MKPHEIGAHIGGNQESPEELKARLSKIVSEINRLKALSKSSGENIDVELSSAEYVDYGHMAQARELEIERKRIEDQLQSIDDQAAAQRNLAL